MFKFTIQFSGRDDQAIHDATCADLKKARNLSEHRETVTAATAVAAAKIVLGDEDEDGTLANMGYSVADFHILPCAAKLR